MPGSSDLELMSSEFHFLLQSLDATPGSQVRKLREEVNEIECARLYGDDRARVLEEISDLIIVALQLGHFYGADVYEMLTNVESKLWTNLHRDWEIREGVVKHK